MFIIFFYQPPFSLPFFFFFFSSTLLGKSNFQTKISQLQTFSWKKNILGETQHWLQIQGLSTNPPLRVFSRDFRINIIHRIEFCILICIVNKVYSIYSFDVFSLIKVKNLELLDLRFLECCNCKIIWVSIFLESKESLIFQVFNLSEDVHIQFFKSFNSSFNQ